MRLVVPVLCVALWQLTPPRSVPPFDDVMAEVSTVLTSSTFAADLAASGGRWVAGLALALLIGVPLGAAMGRSKTLTRLVEPALVAGFPVPKAALILLFVLWWGAGETSRIAIVVVGALIPIVVAAQHGAAGVPDALLWAAGARWRRTVLLAALPQILSGLRIALAIAVFTVLASELLIRGTGLGAAMFTALDNGQTVTVFALASIVAGLGFALDALYVLAVRHAVPWLEGEV